MAIDLESMDPADAEFARRHLPMEPVMALRNGEKVYMPKPTKPLCGYDRVGDCVPGKKRGEPNKLEADFAAHVHALQCDYEIMTFHLGRAVSYTPDWCVSIDKHRLAMVEVKLETSGMNRQARSRLATQNRESRTKLKLCADRYPMWSWYLAKRDKFGKWNVYPVTAAGISRKAEVVPWVT